MRKLSLLAPLAFVSCAPLNWAQPEAAYGNAPTAERLREHAAAHLDLAMFDPESRREKWADESPRQSARWDHGQGWVYGWGMRFLLNGKNQFGGYTGWKEFFVFRSGSGSVVVNQILYDPNEKPFFVVKP